MSESSTASRILTSLKKKVVSDKEPIEIKSFTKLFDRDVKDDLIKLYAPKHIQLPTLQFSLDVEFKARDKDLEYLMAEGVAPFVQQKAQDYVAIALKPVAKVLRFCDLLVGTELESQTSMIEEVKASVEKAQATASTEMTVLLEAAIRAFIKDKQRLKSFRIKSVAKIVTSSITIVGSIAHAALSWGATSPLAIVSIARSTIIIVQTIGELAAKASHMAMLIVLDFKVLDTIITTAKDVKTPQATKMKNDAIEIGITAIASITGLKLPSVENCGKRIDVYKTCITKIELQILELSKSVREAMALNAGLEEVVMVKSTSALKRAFGDNGKGLSTVLDKIISLNGDIVAGHAQTLEFEERYKEFKDAKHSWTKWVGVGFDIVVEGGLNAGAVHQDGSAITDIMNAMIERTLEVFAAAESGAIDVALEHV